MVIEPHNRTGNLKFHQESLPIRFLQLLYTTTMNVSPSPSEILAHLNEAHKVHVHDITKHADHTWDSSDEKQVSNNPISSTFYDDSALSAIKAMCNLTAFEFDEIRLRLSDHVIEPGMLAEGVRSI